MLGRGSQTRWADCGRNRGRMDRISQFQTAIARVFVYYPAGSRRGAERHLESRRQVHTGWQTAATGPVVLQMSIC